MLPISHDDADVVSDIPDIPTLHVPVLIEDDARVDAEGVYTPNPSCVVFEDDEHVDAEGVYTTKHSWLLSEDESSKDSATIGTGAASCCCR
jgi:hypothetical protein